ncbi:MAG: trigger factor [Planctomycetota bacterium]
MSNTQSSFGGGSTSVTVDSTTAVNAPTDQTAYKLSLEVKVEKTGPCKRHVSVKVPRKDLDFYYEAALKDLVKNAAVPGFRAGHVPRKLVEKRFKKDVSDHVRQQILVDSLEQLAAEHDLDAINEPDLAVADLILPETGDFEYEFNVEVRPEFDLPSYKGLTIKRPVKEFGDADVDTYLERLLSSFSGFSPADHPAASGDAVRADITIEYKGEMLGRHTDRQIVLKPTLALADAELTGFDALLAGAVPGDKRQGEATVSLEAANVEMRGEKVQLEFDVLEVLTRDQTELSDSMLATFGASDKDELRTSIRTTLDRQLKYTQRQSARTQVLDKITESANWDLPESLVRRQVENAMRRELLEMEQAGYTPEAIRSRENELRQNAISTTRQALKEHFVLDRIATEEKLDVTPEDMETEVYMMAMQRGENPRRVRARLEKQGLMENLAAQILERKAIDIVLDSATYEDEAAPAEVTSDVTSPEGLPIEVCKKSSGSAPVAAE